MTTKAKTTSPITSLVIDRSKWLTGREALDAEKDKAPRLLSPTTGRMCCIGFLCLAEGLKEDQIKNHGMPAGIDYETQLTTTDEVRAQSINDSQYDVERKERELIKVFADHDIALSFTGELHPKKEEEKS